MQPQLIPLERFVAANSGGNPFGPRLVPRLPGYLVFLCVFSLLLGCLGMLRGGCAVLSRPAVGFHPRMQPRQVDSAEVAMARARAIDSKYHAANRTLFGAQAVIGLIMVIGAALVLQSQRPGDILLRGAYGATLLTGAVQMLPFLFQMLEHLMLSRQLAAQTSRVAPQEIAGINQVAAITMLTAVVGTLVAIAWLIFKVALLGHGFKYLGRPEVQVCLK